MSDCKPDYNGWTNYETWCVNLWLDNEQGTSDEKRDVIRHAATPYRAADALKAWVEDMQPDLGASLWADLLGAALSEVNWDEIVTAEWDDLHGEPVEEEA